MRSPSGWRRIGGAAAAGLLLAAGAVFGPRVSAGPPPPPARYRATLVAVERCPVASSVDGIVGAYDVAEGGTVEKGAPVVHLVDEDADFEAAIATAEVSAADAAVAQAENEHRALETLLLHEAAKRYEVDRAATQLRVAVAKQNAAQARLDRARWRVASHVITAPRAGVLITRRKLPGQGVRAFETVCEIIDPSQLYAVIQVPLAAVANLTPGTDADFFTPSGVRLEGRCQEIGLEVNPGADTVQVKVILDNAAGVLRPGGRGEVVLGGD